MLTSIWNEKYRPKNFDDLIGRNVLQLRKITFEEKIPHLLFTGPAGVGKTTAALVIGREVFGDSFDSNFMELNASDERGIDTIRHKVKDFAQTRGISEKNFKIILLDEADALTHDSQTALRRIMEKYHLNCRFILTGNFVNKIIEPLRSRCMKFQFGKLSKGNITKRLKFIIEQEGIKAQTEALKKIVDMAYPDMRKTINLLQKTAIKGDVSVENIEEEQNISKEILEHLLGRRFLQIREIVIQQNPDLSQLVVDLYEEIIRREEIQIKVKKKCIILLAECSYRLSFVADKEIQFASTVLQLMEVMKDGDV